MRLIDADALMHNILNLTMNIAQNSISAYAVEQQIKNATTIDAVEVVRCNECTRYQGVHGVKGHAMCKRWESNVLWDNFCSYGERREK